MSKQSLHRTSVDILPSLPSQVPAASHFRARARVECSFGCDLRGGSVSIVSADGKELVTVELVAMRDGKAESEEFSLQAPKEGDDWTWGIVYQGNQGEDADHEESELVVASSVGPDILTPAVWGAPSPLTAGEEFSFYVGASTLAGTFLGGTSVAIRTGDGELVADTEFGEAPWGGAPTLYWVKVTLSAPNNVGIHHWSVELSKSRTDDELVGQAELQLRVAPPPEVQLAIRVQDKETKAPVFGAALKVKVDKYNCGGSVIDVDLPTLAYSSSTDEHGLAVLNLPSGKIEISCWKPEYSMPIEVIELLEPMSVDIDAVFTPKQKKEQVWG